MKWLIILERRMTGSVDPSRGNSLAETFSRISRLFRGSCLPVFPKYWIRGRNWSNTPIVFTFVFIIKSKRNYEGIAFHTYPSLKKGRVSVDFLRTFFQLSHCAAVCMDCLLKILRQTSVAFILYFVHSFARRNPMFF